MYLKALGGLMILLGLYFLGGGAWLAGEALGAIKTEARATVRPAEEPQDG